MVDIPKDKWFIVTGETKPSIECPQCNSHNLGDNAPHGVRLDGTIYESVICWNCGFHNRVKLLGWNLGEIKHK